MLGKVEVVNLAEPARQRAQVCEARPLNGADRLALLSRQANLAPNDRAFERHRRDDENEMLQRLGFERVLDLAPPVAPAFERDNVLPDREIALAQPCAQPLGEGRAILAGVGNESAALLARHCAIPPGPLHSTPVLRGGKVRPNRRPRNPVDADILFQKPRRPFWGTCVSPLVPPEPRSILANVKPRRRRPRLREILCRSSIMVIGAAHIQPIVAIIAGVLILVWPRLLNYVVAIYLILTGILGLGLLR